MGYYRVYFKKKNTYGEVYHTRYTAIGYKDATKQFYAEHSEDYEIINIVCE